MALGYTIRVTTGGGDDAAMQEIYQVAIDDENRAKEAARQAAGVPSDALIEVEGELELTDLKWLALRPGQIIPAR